MLSRVANSMYWMSRYIERAENTARLMEVNLQLLGDFEAFLHDDRNVFWHAIVQASGAQESFDERYNHYNSEEVTFFLTFDRDNPSSIFASIATARENARMIRDQLSTDIWECINRIYHFVQKEHEIVSPGNLPFSFFTEIINFSHRFIGLTEATYFHSDGYRFMQIGRLIERSDQTSRMLDIKSYLHLPRNQSAGGTVDTVGWVAILRSCNAIDAFQATAPGKIEEANVVAFLLTSPVFPRAIFFCLKKIEVHLKDLSEPPHDTPINEAERQCSSLIQILNKQSVSTVQNEGLFDFIDRLQRQLIDLNQAIFDTYFAMAMDLPEDDSDIQIDSGNQ